jgi:hypothetical protein
LQDARAMIAMRSTGAAVLESFVCMVVISDTKRGCGLSLTASPTA